MTAQHLARGPQRLRRQAEDVGQPVHDGAPAGMHGPEGGAAAAKDGLERGRCGQCQVLRHARRQAQRKAVVADVPGHLLLGVGVDGGVELIQPEIVAVVRLREAYQAGSGAIGKDRGADEQVIVGAGLVVQRAQLYADHQHARGGLPAHDLGGGGQPVEGGGAAHKPDQRAAHGRRQPQRLGQGIVQPRCKQPGATDRQQVRDARRHLRAGQPAARRIVGQRVLRRRRPQGRGLALVDFHAFGGGGAGGRVGPWRKARLLRRLQVGRRARIARLDARLVVDHAHQPLQAALAKRFGHPGCDFVLAAAVARQRRTQRQDGGLRMMWSQEAALLVSLRQSASVLPRCPENDGNRVKRCEECSSLYRLCEWAGIQLASAIGDPEARRGGRGLLTADC